MVKPLSEAQFHFLMEHTRFSRLFFECNIAKKALPFPIEFQIQTINACNGSCLMCPKAKVRNKKPEAMSNQLFEKIIKEILEETSTMRCIDLVLQNEPLLDDKLFTKIDFIKRRKKGKIFTVVATNGSLLNDEKVKELEDSSLDLLIISLDASTETTYNKVRKGLNFQTVMKNIDNVINSKYNRYLFVGFVKQKDNIAEFGEFERFWKKKGVPVWIHSISNRSGDLQGYDNICVEGIDYSALKKIKYK